MRRAPAIATATAALLLLAACGTTAGLPQASGGPSSAELGTELGTELDGGTATPPSGGQAPTGSLAPTGTPGAVATGAAGGAVTAGPAVPSLRPEADATTSPLTIGFAYPDSSGANSSLGVGTSATSGPRAVMEGLVRAVNASGGLAGRKLTVAYRAVDASSSSYGAQASTVCTYFTQDKPVPVVIDLLFGNRFDLAACLARHGVADLGNGAADEVADRAVPLFATATSMSSTRRYRAVLTGLHATGYLTPAHKVGVLVEDCPPLQRAYQNAVLPTAARLKLSIVSTEQLSCTTGFASAGSASASVQNAVLRFRSRGVDRVLLVSDFEQVLLLLMANVAQSQGWHPGYLLTSTAQTEVMRPNIPSGQWPQLRGMGWTPGLDIDDPRTPLPAADQRCLGLLKSAGVVVSGWQNQYIATTECAALFLLESALRASGGDTRGKALMAGVESLGTGFAAPSNVAGRTSFGPRRHDGPAAVAPFGFVAACSCLRYLGPPVSVP
jgi:hypothetical protein